MTLIPTRNPKFFLRLATNRGEAVFGSYDGERVGFVYFCQTSSAFTGQTGLYIDGLLVDHLPLGARAVTGQCGPVLRPPG